MLFNFKSVADYEALIKSQETLLVNPPLFSVGPDFSPDFLQVLNKLSQLDPSSKGLDFINQVLDREVALQTAMRVLNLVSPPSTPSPLDVVVDNHPESPKIVDDDAIDNIRHSVPCIRPRINIFDGELDSREVSQVTWGESERFPSSFHALDSVEDDDSLLVQNEPKSAGKRFVSSPVKGLQPRQSPYPVTPVDPKDRPLFYFLY